MASIREDEFCAFIKQICPHIDFTREDLADSGTVDSIDMLTILNSVMGHYNIEIDFSCMTPNCFNSIKNLYLFVTGQGG